MQQVLVPGHWASPPREDVRDPDRVSRSPSLLPWSQDTYRNVARPLAQLAVLEEQHEKRDGDEPQRDTEDRQDRPGHAVRLPRQTQVAGRPRENAASSPCRRPSVAIPRSRQRGWGVQRPAVGMPARMTRSRGVAQPG